MASKNKSTQSSAPITPQQRQEAFNFGLGSINQATGGQGYTQGGAAPTFNAPTYNAPTFTGMGDAKTLSGGDYDRLEQSITNSMWAPLQRMEGQERERVDQDLANRGIYSSGLGVRAQGDVTERLAPQYAAMGGQAAAARYGMQSQENQMLNAIAQSEAARRTGFDQSESAQDYASQWAPYEYLMNLWGNTAGQTSTGKSSGFGVQSPVSFNFGG